jgi:glutaconate CoA-transferase, subunit A
LAVITDLRSAVAEFVNDGDCVAMEGFTHLIPFAAAHEVIRQGKQDLTLVRLTPDIIYDQLIGMGCAKKLIFSWGGNPGVGSLHRFRDAIENSWPHKLEFEEHSHAGLANRYLAGASGLPFAILRAYEGTDLAKYTPIARVQCPFSGEIVAAVPALRPDVCIIHAQQADCDGNVLLWGISGAQKEAVLASKRALVTVEEIVDRLDPPGTGVVLPSWVISAVSVVPNGAHPSYAAGYSQRDNNFYIEWDQISRSRDGFREWMEQHVIIQSG